MNCGCLPPAAQVSESAADFIARMNRDYGVALFKGEPKTGKAGGAG